MYRALPSAPLAAAALVASLVASPVAEAAEPAYEDLIQGGRAALEAGSYDEAEARLLQAHAMAQKTGKQDPRYLEATLELARLYRTEKEWAAAIPLVEEAVALQESAVGPDRLGLAAALNELGILRFRLGKYPEAEAAYTRALAIRREMVEPDHPLVARVTHNLAELYRVAGSPEKSEVLFEQALKDKEKTFGDDHASLVSTLNDLGLLQTHTKRLDEARKNLLRAHALARKHAGAESDQLGTVSHNLGNLEFKRGKYADAEAWFKQAIHIREKLPQRYRPGLARSVDALANTWVQQKRYGEAEANYEWAVALATEHEGAKSAMVAKVLEHWAMVLKIQGKKAEAEALTARAKAIRGR